MRALAGRGRPRVQFLLPEGVALPTGFFELTQADWDALLESGRDGRQRERGHRSGTERPIAQVRETGQAVDLEQPRGIEQPADRVGEHRSMQASPAIVGLVGGAIESIGEGGARQQVEGDAQATQEHDVASITR